VKGTKKKAGQSLRGHTVYGLGKEEMIKTDRKPRIHEAKGR
jgi:hypothetical protein